MYVQLQFKSFYKIHNTSLQKNNLNNKNNTGKNLIKVMLLFLFVKQHKLSELDEITSSIFYLPIKKKSIIFLRAPYKNKLARLNILNLEFTSIVSFRTKTSLSFENLKSVNDLGNCLFATNKLKHVKTKINTTTTNKHNFKISDYN